MRTASKLGLLLVFVSAIACAGTWSGKLYDAKCLSDQETQDLSACTPTDSTTTFVLQVADRMYKFDNDGNKKAVEAYKKSKSGAERAEDAEEEQSEDVDSGQESTDQGSMDMEKDQERMDKGGQEGAGVIATVQGTLVDDQIRIETIEVK